MLKKNTFEDLMEVMKTIDTPYTKNLVKGEKKL